MILNGESVEFTNLRDLIVERAKLGDKPLLICRGEVLTYEEADKRSNRVANALADLGVGKGDVVATFMYNSCAHALIWFACAKLGAVWAPLNVSLTSRDLEYSLTDCLAKIAVVDSELLETFAEVREALPEPPFGVVYRSSETEAPSSPNFLDFEELLGGAAALPDVEISGDDSMAIVYTGGSTSMPKGVLVPHIYYIGAAMRYRDIVQPTEKDVHFANSHFFHVGGQQFGVTGPLFCEITGVMTKWFSASRYWDIVRDTGATIIDPLGTMISVLLTAEPSDVDRQHAVRLGIGIASGQVRRELRDEFERRFGVILLEVYSMTEMGVLALSERVDDRRAGSSGRSHGWADVLIVNEADMPVEAGETGQILLRPTAQNCFMKEYINKPRETLATWRNLWYHTGDLGYVDADGYLYFVGRQAHWIRRRGENVSAFEVEKTVTSHPMVQDCAAVGVLSDLGEEDIKVYVQLVVGGCCEPKAIVEWCRERIAYFKVPRYVQFVEEFPRTLTKKEIARHELRDLGVGDSWDANEGVVR